MTEERIQAIKKMLEDNESIVPLIRSWAKETDNPFQKAVLESVVKTTEGSITVLKQMLI